MKRKVPRPLLLFWIVGFGLLGLRGCYDLKMYFFGATVAVRQSDPDRYDYLLHFPKGYHDLAGPRPLLVFLHGAGEVGCDVAELQLHDPFRYANGTVADFPFLVVSPVSPVKGWDAERVIALIDELQADSWGRYRIDSRRIYLTGSSMGGFGTFQIAGEYPDHFAAIVPVAGGGDPALAERLLTVPVWAFHGDRDDVVDIRHCERMMEVLREQNHPDAQFTVISGGHHDINETTYANPMLYRWLLEHEK